MSSGFKEILNKAEALIEHGNEAEERVQLCQSRAHMAASRLYAAERALSAAMETGENGNPLGDVHAAQIQVRMAQGQLAASRRAVAAAKEQAERVKREKVQLVKAVEQRNRVGRENLGKVRSLSGSPFSSRLQPLATDIAERQNQMEEAKVKLLRSMDMSGPADYLSAPELGNDHTYAGSGGNFAALNVSGVPLNAATGRVIGEAGGPPVQHGKQPGLSQSSLGQDAVNQSLTRNKDDRVNKSRGDGSGSEAGGIHSVGGIGNTFHWTGKNFIQMGKSMSPNEMISNLEKLGWTKTAEPGGKKSGPATILADPSAETIVRIHSEPGEGTPYFRVKNKSNNYLNDNGVFSSKATKQELRDTTHFYYEK